MTKALSSPLKNQRVIRGSQPNVKSSTNIKKDETLGMNSTKHLKEHESKSKGLPISKNLNSKSENFTRQLNFSSQEQLIKPKYETQNDINYKNLLKEVITSQNHSKYSYQRKSSEFDEVSILNQKRKS